MKSVLISIHPKWCDLIASGEKTIEVCKTRPKIETPFRCYIYETKARSDMPTFVDEDGHVLYTGRGQVIGEFVCDYVYENMSYDCEASCVSVSELKKYANGKPLYGWHISDLKIYDKPRELSEFRACNGNCNHCKHRVVNQNDVGDVRCENKVTRPPQSYMFVEEE
jgi:predicted transcriptional regulator